MVEGKVSASRLAVIAIALLCALAIMSSTFPVYPPVPYGGFLSIGLSQVAAQSSGDWTINGTTVYIENDRAFLSATPHTLESSGWVEFELLSKKWSGDVDVVWGFPAGVGVKPRDPQRWALNVSHERTRWVSVEEQYTLDVCNISGWTALQWDGIEPDWGNRNNEFIYNITASDWRCTGNSTNATSYIIAFNSYEGNKQHATFYGNRNVQREEVYYEYYDDWVAWNPPPVASVDYSYAGVDEWHVVRLDKSVVAGKTYKVRAWIDVPVGLGRYTYKYVWAVKPQSETIQEAKANGHLYLLDPWLSGGWSYRKKVTIAGSSGAGTNYQVLLKVGESSGATGANFHVAGHSAIFPSGHSSGDLRFTASDGSTLEGFWVEKVEGSSPNRIAYCWVKVSANLDSNQDIYCYYGNSNATDVSSVSNTFIREIDGNQPVKGSWHLDEGSGTSAADTSGNGNTGALTNGPTWVDGKFGKALSFDGVDDYVWLGAPTSLRVSNFTIAAWFKTTTASGGARNIYRWRLYGIGLGVPAAGGIDGTCRVMFYDSAGNLYGVNANQTSSDGYWHFVVGTYDGASLKLYLDNSLNNSLSTTASVYYGTGGAAIGREGDAAGGYFNGLIDEVQIYNRALTTGEISDLYNYYGYTTTAYAGRTLVRKRISPEPAFSTAGSEEVAGGQPWLTGWSYRKKITITGSTGAGTNYQVLLKVGESSGATGANFHVNGHSAIFPSSNSSGDLRFTTDDGSTLLSFWVEKVEGSSPNRVAWCWVKVSADLGSNQDIYCYYGNSNATNVSNAPNTFIVGELFPNTTHWTVLAGTWSLVSGEGNFPPAYKGVHDGTTGNRKSSRSDYSPPADFRLLARVKSSVANSLANIIFRAATNGNDDNNRIWVRLDQRDIDTTIHVGGFHLRENVDGTEYVRGYYDFKPTLNQWYHWEITASGTTIKGYLDGTLRWTGTVSRTAAGYLLVQVEFASGHDAFFDYICIGKYIPTEPAFSAAGSEQAATEITNTPTSKDFGTLAVGVTGVTSINYFTVTNTGGCAVDITIQGTDLSGGDDTWDLADDGSPGENIYGLYAGLDDTDDTFDVIVREATPYNTLVSGLAVNATQSWGLKIYMPTSVSNYDGQQMSGTVTLVASAAS